ncbi:hypothetical protein A6X21_20760 [Planctopirus hydrillae]|uniref:Uncharacterized protein n=1 Tax=Planctopirus hydrillae TaxID=1841610 RepID=A0A1C3EHP8_9PLAN|nr:hypothetical protein A6X21_20760 [Planctopirus hydrillae]
MSPVSEIEEAMGLSPRRFSLWNRWTYLHVPPPDWLRERPADELKTYFRWLPRTFRYGKVVMGCVIQANQYAWEKESFDVPGEVVYSLMDAEWVTDDDLLEVAKRLFKLKGASPQKSDSKEIADYLTNQRIRVFGLPVPREIYPRYHFQISTIMFVRKHMPEQRICSKVLPLIVYPNEPYVATIVPMKYWPEDYIKQWTNT